MPARSLVELAAVAVALLLVHRVIPLGFFRIERLEPLKKVDMVCTLEVSQNNLRGESHVHQPNVSHVRHSWLRVPPQ
jgi:hypothetical protein